MVQQRKKTTTYDYEAAKEKYRAFCASKGHDIQVFAQPWFLDAACGSDDGWKVITYEENGRICASFPFSYCQDKHGFWLIGTPFQAARLGIWIDYGNRTAESAREAFENKVVQYIIDNLPPYDNFSIWFDSRFQNWQQFYRNGFSQTTRYSYVIDQPPETLFDSFTSKKKRELRTLAENNQVIKINDLNTYWSFFEQSYRERGRTISFPKQTFITLASAVLEHQAGTMYLCIDKQTNAPTSATFLFHDSRRSYNMFNTFLPQTVSSQSLCTYEAIKDTLSSGRVFDFEGSMIPGVALYNSKFNAVKEPYFMISDSSYRFRLYGSLRSVIQSVYHILKGHR